VQPALASSNGRLMLLWTDGSTLSVRATELGTQSSQPVYTLANNAHSPSVSAYGNGGFVAAWTSPSAQKSQATYATFWSNTELPGTTPVVAVGNPQDARPEHFPSVAQIASNVYVAVWSYTEGEDDGDFAIMDQSNGAWPGVPTQEAAAHARLGGGSNQTDLEVHATGQGAWLTWRDDGLSSGASVASGIDAAFLTNLSPCSAGYTSAGVGRAGCADVNECIANTDTCDGDPEACLNTAGSFSCVCPVGYTGAGAGVSGCVWADPSLVALTVSAGTLTPAFDPTITQYALALPPAVAVSTLAPVVAQPGHASITVNGAATTSGTATGVFSAFMAPTNFAFVVTAESGATKTYTVTVTRTPLYVKASNTDANDIFGARMAISADGTIIAVAAPFESSSNTGGIESQADNSVYRSGAVYVFEKNSGVWSQIDFIKASNAEADDQFGAAIDLSSDGSVLVVGSTNEGSGAAGVNGDPNNNAALKAGAVYVFNRAGSRWVQDAYLKASNPGAGDTFGMTVSISSDGRTVAVGAGLEDSDARGVNGASNELATDSGAAYVFTRGQFGWVQEAYIKSSNSDIGDEFGRGVSLSDDGNLLATSAIREDSSAAGVNGDQSLNNYGDGGAVYLFRRTAGIWSQEAYVKASNPGFNADFFGIGLSISGDGSTLAVGATNEDSSGVGVGAVQSNDAVTNSGAVYVFKNSGGSWFQDVYIKSSNSQANDGFGYPKPRWNATSRFGVQRGLIFRFHQWESDG
jgi:hypothetical protein